MIIYIIENNINNKKYIGQTTTNLNHRFQRGHLSEARTGRGNAPLYNAIRKYGEDNFYARIIEKCSSQEELNEREKYWIQKFNTITPKGYNVLEGGDSKTHNQETRDKISRTRRLQIENGWVPGFTGKSHSEQTRTLLSQKSMGNNNAKGSVRSDDYRNKQRRARLGKSLSSETKNKISEAVRGKSNPNYGKRGSETSRYGVKVSEKTRQKLRDAWARRKEKIREDS